MARSKAARALPTQERAHETVKALLDATEQVAARVGFQAATTKEIARVAGVSAGTLYRYYPSKEVLLNALVRRQWEAGVHDFGGRVALLREERFDVVVEEVVKHAFDMVATRVATFGKMQIELGHVVQVNAELVTAAVAVVRGALERRSAELAEVDLDVAALLVVRTVVFLARVGAQEYADLVASGRYPAEVARMVRRYLAK
ncbi:MAG: TetR/AcrR family transcriptional regulator [Labilithrix sp.]|nr:TetR/AcrR family transcriptional regulator [Labilithrix sp.]MCW5809694.1 TetR/AcrR family transcriptional regulator [Labilithrix sp.]